MTLKQTDEEEVPLDEWTARAVELLDLAEAENEQLKKNVHGLKQTISNLHDQLQGLTEAKLQHDNSLLHNFSEILNSKKLKIRDQQRLLAGAKVDPSAGTYTLLYIAAPLLYHATRLFTVHFAFASRAPSSRFEITKHETTEGGHG